MLTADELRELADVGDCSIGHALTGRGDCSISHATDWAELTYLLPSAGRLLRQGWRANYLASLARCKRSMNCLDQRLRAIVRKPRDGQPSIGWSEPWWSMPATEVCRSPSAGARRETYAAGI